MSERPLMLSVASVQLRRATLADAPVLGALRAAMRAENFARDLSRAMPVLRAWVGCDAGRVIATAVLMILPTLPRLGSAGSVDGRVRDVYVLPTHRRRGIARALMALVLDEARALRIDRLSLGASAMGRPLYESLGFISKSDEMILS